MPTDQIWIVKAQTSETVQGWVYLPDYAALQKFEVGEKVLAGARRDGFHGTLADRLKDLHWEIVRVRLIEDT